MKIRLEMKNRSHRYDINRPRQIQGHKYTKYKMFLGIIMVVCIKQRLSNIWSSIHEAVHSYPIKITFINPGETLALWLLALEQEPSVIYKKGVKEDIAN